MGVVVCYFFGCATTARVTKFDIGYFEQFRQPGHRLVYITSETSGLVPREDIYVLTNPDDIALLNKAPGVYMGGNLSPVYIPNHKTDGGKGLAVFSLPKRSRQDEQRREGFIPSGAPGTKE